MILQTNKSKHTQMLDSMHSFVCTFKQTKANTQKVCGWIWFWSTVGFLRIKMRIWRYVGVSPTFLGLGMVGLSEPVILPSVQTLHSDFPNCPAYCPQSEVSLGHHLIASKHLAELRAEALSTLRNTWRFPDVFLWSVVLQSGACFGGWVGWGIG